MSYVEQIFIDKQVLTHTDLNTMSKGIVSKQDELVSGVSIKTINGISLLGAGNIELDCSIIEKPTEVVIDNLTFEIKQFSGTPEWAKNSKRACALIELSSLSSFGNGAIIYFDATKIAANYFIINADTFSATYTPNEWNTSGQITITHIDTLENRSLVIQIKNIDDSSFTEAKLAESASTVSVKYTIPTDPDKTEEQSYDVIIFMGQSNMAGRGKTSEVWPETAPTILEGAGYEYRAISAPNTLSPIVEPFGKNENKEGGINEPGMKTGSMVTAFINAYYTYCKTPVIAISAAKGGSSTSQWLPTASQGLLADAISRLRSCLAYLRASNISVRHIYMAWCQGCSDGDNGVSEEIYKANFSTILSAMMDEGVEKMFMIRIGNCNNEDTLNRYTNMIKWQTDIAQNNDNVIMVATTFASMRDRGLMKDQFHYYQAGYNECGTQAGINSAFYVNTGKEPTMYDPESDDLYYSHSLKN